MSHSRAGGQVTVVEDEADEEIHLRQLEETSYTRYTKEALKIIDRKHVKLCRAFTDWLLSTRGSNAELSDGYRRHLSHRKAKHTREFKVAYHSDPSPRYGRRWVRYWNTTTIPTERFTINGSWSSLYANRSGQNLSKIT